MGFFCVYQNTNGTGICIVFSGNRTLKNISIELEKGASVYGDQRVADQEYKYANIVVLCLCTGQHSVIKKIQTFWSQAYIVPGIYAGSIGLVEPQ